MVHQGWELAHRFSERITHVLQKIEPMSDLLIYHEQPERIAHGRSFDISDLSDLLTVALLT